MTINYGGREITVNVIGGFEFNNKKYAVCSYIDLENQKIVIVETITDENGVTTTKDIPQEEIGMVLEHFNLIKNELLKEENNGNTTL